MKWYNLLIIVFLLSALTNANAAIIKGDIFEWETLKKLDNVIVEINTKPMQRIVSINGSYEFNVPEGNYIITASYFENEKLTYFTKENIEVKGLGTYNLDLIMMPALEDINEISELNESDENFLFDKTIEESLQEKTLNENIMFVVLLIVFSSTVLIIFFFLGKKIKKIEEKAEKEIKEIQTKEKTLENKEEKQSPKLDSFALQAVQLLKRYGNRMTQKELVEKMNLSEAKISLIVTELEREGLIKKIKKGRGNILVLIEK